MEGLIKLTRIYDNVLGNVQLRSDSNNSIFELPANQLNQLINTNRQLRVKLEDGDGSGGG